MRLNGPDQQRNTRRGRIWNHLPRLFAVLTVVGILFPYAVSFGDQGVTFTLHNKTKYFVHAYINNNVFLYIAPNRVVTYQSDQLSNIVAEVFYSPGQGVEGSVEKTFEAVQVRDSKSSGSATCQNNSGNCESTTDASSTVSVSPITWEVSSTELAPN